MYLTLGTSGMQDFILERPLARMNCHTLRADMFVYVYALWRAMPEAADYSRG